MKRAFLFPGQGAQIVGMGKIFMKNMKKQEKYMTRQVKYQG